MFPIKLQKVVCCVVSIFDKNISDDQNVIPTTTSTTLNISSNGFAGSLQVLTCPPSLDEDDDDDCDDDDEDD